MKQREKYNLHLTFALRKKPFIKMADEDADSQALITSQVP